MTLEDLLLLQQAKHALENPGLAARITNVIGRPIEQGIKLLPETWARQVSAITNRALETALEAALVTLDKKPRARSSNIWHKSAVIATGAGGGAFGLAALAVELPVSTTIILRSIADIARSETEDLSLPLTKLACLEVFALGGRTSKDDAAESGYFIVRAALAKAVSEAAQFIAERGVVQEGAPAIARLITLIAGRFGTVVSEKVAAEAIPIVGAVGGALINLAFIDYFQSIAKGHFVVRRLERVYGTDVVRSAYERLSGKP
jgi:hypothetical protein